MKIALTIPTGRPRVKQVINAFVDNATFHGYNPKDFSVYLSIDTYFNKKRTRDFQLGKRLESNLGNVQYISPIDRRILAKEIIEQTQADPLIVNDLFSGRGYSRQRNSALLYALKEGNDLAICIDDDEAPFVPVQKEDKTLEWQNLDFFGPHIMMLCTEADITRGPYMGYLSPIPSDFARDIPGNIRRQLGEALQPGSDVINRDSFFNLMNKIRYLSESELNDPSRPLDAEETKFGKHIYSGNMGINLNSVREGKVPIFYTPPNARGEDTIFALQLSHLNVVEVPSYIFHDPFNLYPGVLNKEFPEKLKNIPVNEQTKNRFADALIGWLKYAPILINMTSKDSQEREERINEMLEKIEEPTKKLADLLDCKRLSECKNILQEYSKNVIYHYDSLIRSQQVWKEVILPKYTGNPLVA